MSIETRETANTAITIWYKREAGGGYSGTTTYDVATTTACFMKGGSKRYSDSTGVEFVPRSMYWMEVLAENPRVGDFVALGDQSLIANPSSADGAESIRVANLQDCSELGDIDDIEVIT